MGRGLDLILSKIREQPSPMLASRYLALVAELRDELEKMTRTLDLAEILVSTRPKEALRLALLAHRADRGSLRPLEVMIAVMEAQGKSDRVAVLKEEKRRLAAEGAPRLPAPPQKPGQPIFQKLVFSNTVGAPQDAESRILEAILGDLMEQDKDEGPRLTKPVQTTLTFPVNQPSSKAPTQPVPKALPKALPKTLPKENKVAPGRPKEPHSLTQLSPRIVKGLQGKKPGDTIIGIRAHSSPPGTPNEIPVASPRLGDDPFILDLEGKVDQQDEQPQKIQPPIGQPVPSQEPPQTKITSMSVPSSAASSLGSSVATPIAINFTPQPPPLPDLGLAKPDRSSFPAPSPVPRPSSSPIHESIPTDLASPKDLLAELGRIAAREEVTSFMAHLGKESTKETQGDGSLETIDPDSLRELMARLDSGQGWEKVAWDLLQGLWGPCPNEQTREVLEACSLSHQTPGFWGFYLDALCQTGDFRRALWEVRTTLKDRPTLPWVEVATRRLPQIWNGMGVRGIHWQPEDGVATLLQQLSRSPLPMMAGLVPCLVE